MSSKELTALALKIFAIYVLVQGLLALPQAVATVYSIPDGHRLESGLWRLLAAEVFLFVMILGVAYYLWRLAGKLREHAALTDSTQPMPDAEGFFLSVLGVFLIVQALVRIMYVGTGIYVQATDPNNPSGIALETVALLTGNLLQGLVGLSLILRTAGWVILLRKLREAGLRE